MSIENNNPLISSNEITKFDTIALKHFMPAIDQSMKSARTNLKFIIGSNEKPDFSNTVLALLVYILFFTVSIQPISIKSFPRKFHP